MAKVNAPFLSVSASGSVNKSLQAGSLRGTKWIRPYVGRTYQRTEAQSSQREKYKARKNCWLIQPTDLKKEFNLLGSLESPPITGYNYFLRKALTMSIETELAILECISGYKWSKKGLLATGQLTQYSSELDDGYYKKGIPKDYTVLNTGQYSGTTNITLNGKTDVHSNNCVLDNVTDLMWSRYVAAAVGPLSNGKMPWTGTVEDIFAYCTAANQAKLSGFDDWRIPYDLELLNLRDMEQPNALPDAIAFPGWPTGDYFWSSTTLPFSADYAMSVYFNGGSMYYAIKTNSNFVALVRGG